MGVVISSPTYAQVPSGLQNTINKTLPNLDIAYPINPTYAQVPSNLQDVLNNAPYLNQSQKNDMLSIWTGNPQTGNENYNSTTNVIPKGYSNIGLQAAVSSLFNPTPSSGIQSLFSQTANQGLAAANAKESKQTISAAPVSGYKTATMNATGRNFTPSAVANYEKTVANQNQQTQSDWTQIKQSISALNSPTTQTAYVTQAMSGALEAAMQEMGQNDSFNPEQSAQQLSTLISNNNQFTSQMTQLFQNSLGLSYNIPDEVMNELTQEANNNG